MLRILALVLVIPLLDVLLLFVLTGVLGWELVILLVVLTALVGMLLVRAEGRHTMRKLQRKAATGEIPTNELVDGGLLLVAGVFLVTPGLVTDVVGFLFAIPITRYPIRWAVKKWVLTPYADAKTGGFATGNVYVGGFPEGGDLDEGEGPVGGGQGPFGPGGPAGGRGHGGEDTVDIGEDAYDIGIDEDDADEDDWG